MPNAGPTNRIPTGMFHRCRFRLDWRSHQRLASRTHISSLMQQQMKLAAMSLPMKIVHRVLRIASAISKQPSIQ